MWASLKSGVGLDTPKKKKATAKYALYDVMVSSNTKSANVNNNNNSSSVFSQMNEVSKNITKYSDTVLVPKQFVHKKKKKRISILKKRILLERMKKHIEHMLTMEANTPVENTLTPVVEQTMNNNQIYCVRLYDFVSGDDIMDEDEKLEVVTNMKDLLSPFKHMLSLEILQSKTDENICYLSVAFSDLRSAQSATSALNGLVFSGSPIRAILCSDSDSGHTHISAVQHSHPLQQVSVQNISCRERGLAVLCLENLLSPQDVVDQDEVQEILTDLHSLCGAYAGLLNMWIELRPLHTIRNIATNNRDDISLDQRALECADAISVGLRTDSGCGHRTAGPSGVVEFASVRDAVRVMDKINKRGACDANAVRASLLDYSVYVAGKVQELKLQCSIESGVFAVRLNRFVESEQVLGEGDTGVAEEREEIVTDIHTLVHHCHPEAVVSAIYFQPCRSGPADSSALMDVIVALSSLAEAVAVCDSLGAQVIGGARLVADVVSIEKQSGGHIGIDCNTTIGIVCNQSSDLQFTLIHQSWAKGAAVLVSPVVGVDVLSIRRELIRVVRNTDCDLEDEKQCFLSRVMVCGPEGLVSPRSAAVSGEEKSNQMTVVACLEFSETCQAEEALLGLDGFIVGGQAIRAHLEPVETHPAAKESMEQDDIGANSFIPVPAVIAFSATLSELSATEQFIGTNYSTLASEQPLPPASDAAEDICLYFELLTGGEVETEVETAECVEDVMGAAEGTSGDGAEPVVTGAVSKYVAARTAPKLSMRSTPVNNLKVADEATDALVRDFLTRISTFQARAKEKNPLKARQKVRFVAGIKQASSAVKVGKARLLLLALNTEESEELDMRIGSLVTEAMEREVPTLYCLSKRRLGKALQMTMKQSVVAVLDPDGAYDLYKKIVVFINTVM